MKAVIMSEFGGLDKLKYADIPAPSPGPGDVLIRVRACGVNRLDLWVRRGVPSYNIALPHIPGSEISGEVAALGEGVTGIRIGERAGVYPGLCDWTCRYCLKGENSICENFRIIGARAPGGYAEYVVVPAANLVRIPENLSFEEMAVIPLTFLTAWHLLITRAALRPGEDVLIQAGGSGIGSAGIQIAKLAGAHVFTTASTDDKLKHAKALGADCTINYSHVSFADEISRLTDNRGVAVVFEHAGETTFERSLASLARGGRLVICGATSGSEGHFDIRLLYGRELSIIGSMLGNMEELHTVTRLAGEGKLKPIVERVMPLKDAVEAQRLLEDRKVFGKIVLVP